MDNSNLAFYGGPKTVNSPFPHFQWPPPIPELPDRIVDYIRSGARLSIVDRWGIFKELEDKLCQIHGRKYAILMSFGTMALYSAFPGADAYCNSILSLPTFTFKQGWPLVDQYVAAFHKILSRKRQI